MDSPRLINTCSFIVYLIFSAVKNGLQEAIKVKYVLLSWKEKTIIIFYNNFIYHIYKYNFWAI